MARSFADQLAEVALDAGAVAAVVLGVRWLMGRQTASTQPLTEAPSGYTDENGVFHAGFGFGPAAPGVESPPIVGQPYGPT